MLPDNVEALHCVDRVRVAVNTELVQKWPRGKSYDQYEPDKFTLVAPVVLEADQIAQVLLAVTDTLIKLGAGRLKTEDVHQHVGPPRGQVPRFEELSESELRALRDPRNWFRPLIAVGAGGVATGALVVIEMRRRGRQQTKGGLRSIAERVRP